MTAALLLIGALAAIAGWWLARHGIAAKPWLETGPAVDLRPDDATAGSAARIGLGVFMAVATALLVLLLSAYSMRRELADWSPPPQPPVLWANTVLLVLASLALHRAVLAARRGDRDATGSWLLAGAGASLLFVLGQLLAWRQLAAAGFVLTSNPADAFFYLITAVHGLHVLGGLVALGRAGARLRRARLDALRLGVELCAAYWHFLLLAWLLLFATLAFSPSLDWLIALCTAPFG
ncbi:cytochrome c oxidase subunit 3 [Falsiroseomonas oryzae]|uniref:cytochrome c oxidase subunit 3 n=1 Tax=Falsiroseomonas oryzae TaxID=2766473 RepID=UPI0022EAF949|nr:cytochrome c oxidase subunit 3 [Roseomonas sp. MO-31]